MSEVDGEGEVTCEHGTRFDDACMEYGCGRRAAATTAVPDEWVCRHGKIRSEHWCDHHDDHAREVRRSASHAETVAVIRSVFETLRETTDEIEGGQVPDFGWLHSAASIDRWLQARLVWELTKLNPPAQPTQPETTP